MSTLTEPITWRPVADGLPDAESNVLLFADGEEAGSFEGFYDGDDRSPVFRDVTALQVEGVTHWAEMPKGPTALRAAPIVWPKEKSVKRRDDMSASDTLQVGIDESGDLQVSLWTSKGYSSVEFCSGAGGWPTATSRSCWPRRRACGFCPSNRCSGQ